ncbi:hypothetical protein DFH09DRAFT_1273708 [Mycena vulgaris]|nr:hypothetical protein DFH09DRAFT_1273708 [Mycena vulgaris]
MVLFGATDGKLLKMRETRSPVEWDKKDIHCHRRSFDRYNVGGAEKAASVRCRKSESLQFRKRRSKGRRPEGKSKALEAKFRYLFGVAQRANEGQPRAFHEQAHEMMDANANPVPSRHQDRPCFRVTSEEDDLLADNQVLPSSALPIFTLSSAHIFGRRFKFLMLGVGKTSRGLPTNPQVIAQLRVREGLATESRLSLSSSTRLQLGGTVS